MHLHNEHTHTHRHTDRGKYNGRQCDRHTSREQERDREREGETDTAEAQLAQEKLPVAQRGDPLCCEARDGSAW